MRNFLPHILVLCLLGLLIGVPILWRPPEAVVEPGSRRLVVLTPHNEQIRLEIGTAFNAWHKEHYGQPVDIQWRTGGSGEIQRVLLSQYRAELEQAVAQGRDLQSVGYDVVFGGGDYMFDRYFKRGGVTVEMPDASGEGVVTHHASVTQPIELPDELVARVFGDGDIAGAKTYDPDGHWWGVILSSFGIVYNRDVLESLGMDEPTGWADLADERYFTWLAMSDPSRSGSVRVTYNAIIQRLGWERGWWVLRRTFANTRYFSTSSTKVPLDVSAGDSAAGICIDFYGRFQSQAVGGDRVGYVAPAGTTVYACDPVAVLNGVEGERLELAKRFVEFSLSYKGQAVWNFKTDDPDGPNHHELRRPPVSLEMYTPDLMARMVDPVNYYTMARSLDPDTPNHMGTVSVVLHAMAIDTHDDLVGAWRAIQAEQDTARRAEMIAKFDEMPFTEQELVERPDVWKQDPDRRELDRIEWTRFFRERYDEISAGDI